GAVLRRSRGQEGLADGWPARPGRGRAGACLSLCRLGAERTEVRVVGKAGVDVVLLRVAAGPADILVVVLAHVAVLVLVVMVLAAVLVFAVVVLAHVTLLVVLVITRHRGLW